MVATLGHSDNWVSLLAVLHYVLYSPSYLFLSFEIHDHVCSAHLLCLVLQFQLQYNVLVTILAKLMSHNLLPPAVDSVRAI